MRYAGFSLSDADARTTRGCASQGLGLGDPSAELAERLRRSGSGGVGGWACGASAGIASRPMSLATMQGLLGSVSGVGRWHGAAAAGSAAVPAPRAQRSRRRKSSARPEDDAMRAPPRIGRVVDAGEHGAVGWEERGTWPLPLVVGLNWERRESWRE